MEEYEVTLTLGKKYGPVWSALACYGLYLSFVYQCKFNLYLIFDLMLPIVFNPVEEGG
jgi:hypothetical protein